MTKVMLVQPWNSSDEHIKVYDTGGRWGPYSILVLGSQLIKHNHQVLIVDMGRDLVVLGGNVQSCLAKFQAEIKQFQPDIIGFSFMSYQYLVTEKAIQVARKTCYELGLNPMFIAGGIHASIEPDSTIDKLGFDYSFVGEADLAILRLAGGEDPLTVPGVYGLNFTNGNGRGEVVHNLDELPFPNWSLCDYSFYAAPSLIGAPARKPAKILSMNMGRGCVYECGFCAFNNLSEVRFYSPEYLIEQVEHISTKYGADTIGFIDSSIGNNRKLLSRFCELMIQRGLSERIDWFGSIRANQVNEELLKLMWRAGCKRLCYGFESGSQRVLDLMTKGVKLETYYKVAELHNKLGFLYGASIILGYPGEKEEDIKETITLLKTTHPPNVAINWYVPLPGSPDYENLKAKGIIDTGDPREWQRIGTVLGYNHRVYADVPEKRFRQLFSQVEYLATVELPDKNSALWELEPPSPVYRFLRRLTRNPILFRLWKYRNDNSILGLGLRFLKSLSSIKLISRSPGDKN